MFPAVLEELKKVQNYFEAFAYIIDHTEAMVILNAKLARGLKVRLLMDKANFLASSCSRQAARIKELFDHGAEIRILKPAGAGYACMHAKCVILDRELVFDGSVNLTHNGMENNKEHLYRITHKPTVRRVFDDFCIEWARSEIVGSDKIAIMMQKDAETKKRKGNAKGSSNAELRQQTSRDLTGEFQTVDASEEGGA